MLNRIIENIYGWKIKRFAPAAGLFPRQIDVEVTNACNLDCIICPRSSMTRPIGHMKMELFEKLINEVSEFGLEYMDLSLFGEPLLNPNFFEMARRAKEKGRVKHLYTSTNGLLLDEEGCQEFIRAGFDEIIISIDGATAETYEKIRKGGNYREVVENAQRLIKARPAGTQRPFFVLQIIRMKETDQEIEEFKKFWQPYLCPDDVIQIKPYLTFAGKVADRSTEDTDSKIKVRVPCLTYLWRNLAIYQNGDVTACCYDSNGEMVLGNIKNSSIREIWHSQKLDLIRRLHLNRKFDSLSLCKKCPFIKRELKLNEIPRLAVKHLVRPR